MKIHLVSGFLGSGKTTAIQNACRGLLHQGHNTGVITNDQGIKLVDGEFFNSLNISGRQVINGCFCCNYDDLENNIRSLVETNKVEVIFAESVGSCADIVATVLKPLLFFRPHDQVTVTTFTDARLLLMILKQQGSFDESVRYIYLKQLEEAGIIIVNKIDLMTAQQLGEIKTLMDEKYPGKLLLYQNSFDENNIRRWIDTLNNQITAEPPRSLSIDYDVYAEGEAKLAWLDQELEIFSADNEALNHSVDLINNIYKSINNCHYAIGHLKFLINGKTKISFTADNQPPINIKVVPAPSASLLINVRVQTDPGMIRDLITASIREVENLSGCKIIINSLSAFQPGYPRPTHRI